MEGSKNQFGDYGAQQTFGDLFVKVLHSDEVKNYYRDLDISNAIAHVSYESGGVYYQREYLASYPDQILAFRYWSNNREGDDYAISFQSPHDNLNLSFKEELLTITGNVKDNQMAFEGKVRFRCSEPSQCERHQGADPPVYLFNSVSPGLP
jgi:alpha-L-fucosidase 2